MDSTSLSKSSVAFGLSLAITSLVNAVIVVAKEKSTAVMDGMKKVTGHHWTTHALLVLVVFAFVGWMIERSSKGQGSSISASALIRTLVSGVVLAGAIIVGFYLIAD